MDWGKTKHYRPKKLSRNHYFWLTSLFMHLQAGCAKIKIKLPKTAQVLAGYCQSDQLSKGQETALHARCIWLTYGGSNLCMLHLEILLISKALRQHIWARIEKEPLLQFLRQEEWFMAAQNTHSAPGGYIQNLIFNFGGEGLNQAMLNALADACLQAMKAAFNDLQAARIVFNASEIPEDVDVAFNRSIDAYNANPEIYPKLSDTETHKAVNRLMRQIRIETPQGMPKALLNWFGVHGTSAGPDNNLVNADNKGYAASLLEQHAKVGEDYVAMFFCEACADVSPNYHGSFEKKWWPRGKYADPFKSAYFNGFAQFDHAKNMMESEAYDISMANRLVSVQSILPLANQAIENKQFNGETAFTGDAAIGINFTKGLEIDAPGLDGFNFGLLAMWIRLTEWRKSLPLITSRQRRSHFKQQKRRHGSKRILIDSNDKQLLGIRHLRLAPAFSNYAQDFKKLKQDLAQLDKQLDWLPEEARFQLIVLGQVGIAIIPGDMTVAASNRLREKLLAKLEPLLLIDLIVQCYSNEFIGYITTPEEYDQQYFEGAFTLYGRHTLWLVEQHFLFLASQLLEKSTLRKK